MNNFSTFSLTSVFVSGNCWPECENPSDTLSVCSEDNPFS